MANLAATVYESPTVAESIRRHLTTAGPLKVREAVTAQFGQLRSVSDAATVSDVVKAVLDPLAVRVADAVALGESCGSGDNQLRGACSESLAVAEWAKQVLDPLAAHLAETFAAAESTQASATAPGLSRAVADLLAITETLQTRRVSQNPVRVREYVDAVLSLSASAAATDALVASEFLRVALTPLVAQVSDSITVIDPRLTTDSLQEIEAEVADALVVAEALGLTSAQLFASGADAATVAELVAAALTLAHIHAPILDGVAMTDDVAAALATARLLATPGDDAVVSEDVAAAFGARPFDVTPFASDRLVARDHVAGHLSTRLAVQVAERLVVRERILGLSAALARAVRQLAWRTADARDIAHASGGES